MLSRVNDDWLHGKLKSGDKEGAFPASFVDCVPDGLPEMKKNEEPKEEEKEVTVSHRGGFGRREKEK